MATQGGESYRSVTTFVACAFRTPPYSIRPGSTMLTRGEWCGALASMGMGLMIMGARERCQYQ